MVGTANGVAFAITSIFSGLVIGQLGMLWALGLTVAVIGVAAGLDYYLVAAAATGLALFVLVALSWWERRRAGPPVHATPDEPPRGEDPGRLRRR